MKLYCTLILIIIASGNSLAQSYINITGKVTDSSNEAPIPFASVYNKEQFIYTIADSSGKFRLSVNESNQSFYLVISSIGYLNDTLFIKDLSSDNLKSILLVPDPKNLPVVSINAMTARTIVRKAIEAIPENYFDNNFIFNATYCQYHFEKQTDDTTAKAVRLIFANADIIQQLDGQKRNLHANEKIKILNLLRSNVYERNKETHGDHLLDLLEDNPVYHPIGSVLNLKAINSFHFYFDSLTTENTDNYKICYKPIRNDKPKFEQGLIIIDKTNFAILSIRKEEFDNGNVSNRKIYNSAVPYKWDFTYGNFEINFKRANGKYLLESCFRKYIHMLIDNKTHSPAFDLTEYFELNVNEPHKKQIEIKEAFSSFSNLYSFKTPYNESLYQTFLKTDFYFLNAIEKANMISDLKNSLPLLQQFKINCK